MGAAAREARGHRIQLFVLAAVVTVSWPLAVALRLEPVRAALLRPLGMSEPATTASREQPDAPSSAPTTSASAPGTVSTEPSRPTGEPTGEPTAAPAEPAASAEAADAGPPASGELDAVTQCVGSLLAPGAFDRGSPDVSFVCQERYPRKAVTRLQAQISLGQWGTNKATEAMREWATLGWYELAALSLFRGYCCKAPPTLLWTFRVACPIDKAMGRIEGSVARGDNRGVQLALSEYAVMASCLTKKGQATNFGQSELPGPGVKSLRVMLDRRKKGAPDL